MVKGVIVRSLLEVDRCRVFEVGVVRPDLLMFQEGLEVCCEL